MDALTFNLDWNDTQFDWSQSNCFDLGGAVTRAAADCKRTNLNLEDETQRNQPPAPTRSARNRINDP